MATRAQQFLALPPDQKRAVHLSLCEHALAKWDDYAASRGAISYTETVCGTTQQVDAMLPRETLECARLSRDVANVGHRYLEPITAMQDKDLEFPDYVEFAYYSIYNLFKKYAALEDIDNWLIVNQALSSETDESKWVALLEQAMLRATQ